MDPDNSQDRKGGKGGDHPGLSTIYTSQVTEPSDIYFVFLNAAHVVIRMILDETYSSLAFLQNSYSLKVSKSP